MSQFVICENLRAPVVQEMTQIEKSKSRKASAKARFVGRLVTIRLKSPEAYMKDRFSCRNAARISAVFPNEDFCARTQRIIAGSGLGALLTGQCEWSFPFSVAT
jgi:hypothetical protein